MVSKAQKAINTFHFARNHRRQRRQQNLLSTPCRDLLDKGNACNSSVDRLLYVTAFAITAYEGTLERLSKPFNPLLGETFEWQSADGRTRLIAEQVGMQM
jgi:hypothetical protein